jgi:hypothetical protein
MHIRIDHVEKKTKIQVEHVQWVFGGLQASNYEDANIVVIKANPGASHQSSLAFLSIFIIMFCLNVHLSLLELSDTLDALCSPFWLPLIPLLAILRRQHVLGVVISSVEIEWHGDQSTVRCFNLNC